MKPVDVALGVMIDIPTHASDVPGRERQRVVGDRRELVSSASLGACACGSQTSLVTGRSAKWSRV